MQGLAGVWASRKAPLLALGLALLGSAVLWFSLDWQLTFIADDWELLVARSGLGLNGIVRPFHENIVVGPAIVYRFLQGLFGIGSAMPFYVVSLSLFITSAVLLFRYLESRVGPWLAVCAAGSILFLGAAFEDLFWAFQMGYFGSAAAGLGALVAIDRRKESGDLLACVLLITSAAFSSLGLVFVAGAAASLLLAPPPRSRRLFVFLAPAFLFAGWWVLWGREAESHVSLDNLLGLGSYVFKASAAGITSLLGLASDDGSSPDQPNLVWGKVGTLLVVGFVLWRMVRDRGVSRGLAVALTMAFAFWILAGLNRSDERFPTSSRYQFPSALFLLLVIGEALKGIRIPRGVVGAVAVGVVIAAVGGVSLAEREHRDRWLPGSNWTRSTLGAIDLVEPAVTPGFEINFPPNPTVPATSYFSVVNEDGTPGFSETELIHRSENERAAADLTMALAVGLALGPPQSQPGQCQWLSASSDAATGIVLYPGEFMLRSADGSVDVMLRRFAGEGFSVDLGPVPPGVRTALVIPDDRARVPWELGLRGNPEDKVRLCVAAS